MLQGVGILLHDSLMVEMILHVVTSSGIDAEVVIVWVGSGATIEGYHVGPDLVNVHRMCIVKHVGREASARAHVDLQGHEVAFVAQTTMRAVQTEEFEVYEPAAYVEGLYGLTAPVAKVLVHILLDIIGRVEILSYDVGDGRRANAP